MMPSELEYLDSAWEMTVLPQPKAPGMAHVPAQEGAQQSYQQQGYCFA